MSKAATIIEVVTAEQVTQIAQGYTPTFEHTLVQIVVGIVVGLLSPYIHDLMHKKKVQRKKKEGV